MEYPKGFKAEVHSKKPICGVLAVALCAGVSYDVAHANVRRVSLRENPHRSRFGGRTYLRDLKTAMQEMAVKLSETIVVKERIKLDTFAKRVARDGMTYLVQVPGHFVTVRDGIVVDQSASLPVELHKCRNDTVQKFVAVLGKGW